MKRNNYTVHETSSLDRYAIVFGEQKLVSRCDCPFIMPFWLRAWYSIFGNDSIARFIEIYSNRKLLGIAPFMQHHTTVTFMGSESICDYQDVITTRQDSHGFFTTLLAHLKEQDVSTVVLGAMLPGSSVLEFLPQVCHNKNIEYQLENAGYISVLRLPESWDSYIKGLTGKNRHEVRRKLRRLNEAGSVGFHEMTKPQEVQHRFSEFLQMFRQSRKDKEEFLTHQMENYFFKLAMELAENKMLRMGMLTLDDKLIASTFGFNFNNDLYLYNNGFSPAYRHVSSGILCKVMAVKQSIALGMDEFNFLKGDEKYKRHLGGEPIPLKRLKIML